MCLEYLSDRLSLEANVAIGLGKSVGCPSVCHKYNMARELRFTVRLEEREMQSIRQFATQNHVLPSVALRRLVEVGLAENNGQLQDVRFSSRGAPRQQ
jgi:hypothetical protein